MIVDHFPTLTLFLPHVQSRIGVAAGCLQVLAECKFLLQLSILRSFLLACPLMYLLCFPGGIASFAHKHY